MGAMRVALGFLFGLFSIVYGIALAVNSIGPKSQILHFGAFIGGFLLVVWGASHMISETIEAS